MQITSGYDLHSLSLICLKNILAMSAEHFMQLIYSDFKGTVWYLGEADERKKQKKMIYSSSV